MWDPRAFERLWRAQFPGAEAPALRLETARDVERELERCSLNLARLQQVLAQERFKASHLRALLAAEGPAAAGDPRDPEAAVPRAGRSWAAAVHQQLLQPPLRFRAREDKAGAGGDSETLDPNEEFALGPWLTAPCRFRMRGDEAEERPGRESSPHRGTPLIPRAPRPPRGSPDLEQLEAEAEEPPRRGARDHLPPWRRRRFLRAPERDSPAHSSPERDSDGSHHSSDREDRFSAGGCPARPPRPRAPLSRPAAPPTPPPGPLTPLPGRLRGPV
ncbi:serine/arginine repetitive matrix protein 1-like [Cebus imitator]|uniref:serine/arginine repetitive matrix protein 1-like n=1 Tax=Cebus imitator TaxID=2715852 RepID=UPI00189B4117|nr:serine/arginine repetitive matrix protein 1-like [Cebus imitator]